MKASKMQRHSLRHNSNNVTYDNDNLSNSCSRSACSATHADTTQTTSPTTTFPTLVVALPVQHATPNVRTPISIVPHLHLDCRLWQSVTLAPVLQSPLLFHPCLQTFS